MTIYEKRIRERFAALVANPIWPSVEKLVQEDWRDSDEFWFDSVQQHCIDLSKRLGLAIGPARCGDGHAWPKQGDVPDGGECPACAVLREEEARREAADKAWCEAHGVSRRIFLYGLQRRTVL